jgi:hypothetical protein
MMSLICMKFAQTKEKVITVGAEIYCERRGNGPLLLLITVGMGYSGFYSPTADILAERFTVVSYDRTLQLSQQRGSNY